MNISAAAKKTGLSSKTIRYYESIGLVDIAKRADNGYRDYNEADVSQLKFLQRARATGFSIEECRQLIELSQNPSRRSAHVKDLVMEKVGKVEVQIQELTHMHETLLAMASHCAGDEEPQCAIIDELKHEEVSHERKR